MFSISEALNRSYEPAHDVTWRDVDGELVVLDLIQGKYYTFNPIGARMWRAIESDNENLISVVDEIVEKYGVERQKVLEDIEKYLQKMISAKLIIEKS